jgi:hypothetical protein
MAGVMTTQNLKMTWYRDMDKVMRDEYNRHETEYDKFVKVSTETKKHYVRKGLQVTLGAVPEIKQGGPITFDAFADGPNKTVYFNSYALALQVTEDAFDDDLIGITRDAVKELGKAHAYTEELKAWDLINSGFVTTTRAGVDSLALFSNSHVLYGDGSQYGDNLVTGAFSKTTLKEALDLFENMKQERGIPMVSKGPYVVWVGPADRWLAEEILKSEFDPDTGNNTVNPLYGKNITFKVGHFFSTTGAWFVQDMSMRNLELIRKKKLSTREETDFNTENKLWKAWQKYTATFWYWRGIVASAG